MTQSQLNMPTRTITLKSQHGFTLIELVMVIVLLGIISAVALPKFSGRDSFSQRVLFDDTLNAVRYAQKSAIASGCNVKFSVASNSYTLTRDNTCSSGNFSSNLAVINPSGEANYTGSENNVTLTATTANTVFDSLGRADVDNTISVGPRQITIIAATGFSYDSTP